MKVEMTYEAQPEQCDFCGKQKLCVRIFRNAKRGEREHFLIYVCRGCAEQVLITAETDFLRKTPR